MCVYFSIQTQTHTHKLFNFYNLFLNLTKKIKNKINNMRYTYRFIDAVKHLFIYIVYYTFRYASKNQEEKKMKKII